MKCQFDGTREEGKAPRHFSGEYVYKQVKDLAVAHGKKSTTIGGKRKRDKQDDPKMTKRDKLDDPKIRWKKKSILWELPYWVDLAARPF